MPSIIINQKSYDISVPLETPLLWVLRDTLGLTGTKFGCGMGICHQCQCVKKKGLVKNIRTGQLSDYGEELIQLCVSQVMSDVELEA